MYTNWKKIGSAMLPVGVMCWLALAAPASGQEIPYALIEGDAVNQTYSYNPYGPISVSYSLGYYAVTFTGVTPTSGLGGLGHVQVSGHSFSSDYCKVLGWSFPTVYVSCYSSTGTPGPGAFKVWVIRNDNDRNIAYALSNFEGSGSYTSHPDVSTGSYTITRLSTGRYRVEMPGLSGGHVQVTAYGNIEAYCQVLGWTALGAEVLCRNPSGSAFDTQFAIATLPQGATPREFGYAWSGLGSYTYNSGGGAITINQVETGTYTFRFAGLYAAQIHGGNIMVSTYSNGAYRCKTAWWLYDGATSVDGVVRCYNYGGAPVNGQFTIAVLPPVRPPVTTIATSPTWGRSIVVDGLSYTSPKTFNFAPGSVHTIAVSPATQHSDPVHTRYVFQNWSDSGAVEHQITAGYTDRTITATFRADYLLNLIASPPAGGTIVASPPRADGYYTQGTNVQLTATPNFGYRLDGLGYLEFGPWFPTSPASLTMDRPHSITAYFDCSPSLSSTSASAPAASGSVSVTVNTGVTCPWTVSGVPSWISAPTTTGTGQTTLSFTVQPNSGAARSATLTISGHSFTINQSAQNCTYTVTPPSANFSGTGGNGSINVNTQSGCAWNVTGVPSWVTLTSTGSGSGSGAVSYSVQQNAGAARNVQLSIAGGQTHTINQDAQACTFTLSSSSESFGASGGAGSVGVTAAAGCNWTVTGLPGWVTLTSSSSGIGSGTVSYSVQPNTGGARSTQLTIAGLPYGISQSAQVPCGYNLSSSSATFPSGSGSGGFTLSADPGCAWAIGGVPSWIVPNVLSGAGTANVSYSVLANGTGAERTAQLTVGGLTYTVTQASGIPVSTTGLRFVRLTPCRLVETRPEYNVPVRSAPFGPPFLAANETRTMNLPASTVCQIPASAKAYVLNVTVIPRGAVDFVTVWPAGEARPNVWTVRSPDGQIVANTNIIKAGANGGISVFASHNTDMVLDITGYFTDNPAVSNLVYYPVSPCRVIDTRILYRPTPGPFGPGSMSARQTRSFRFPQTPYCTIPAGAAAYNVTVTVAPPGPLPYLTAWPAGEGQPNVSSINSFIGRTLANNVIIPAGQDGGIDVFTLEATDFLMDITGYFAPDDGVNGLLYYPVTQCRVSDSTNAGAGLPFGGPIYENETTRTIPLPTSGCPGLPASARAYALNATVIPNAPMPFLTLYPAGQGRPNASSLNAFEGQTITNSAIIPAGTSGAVDVFAFRRTHVVLEVNGYFGR